MNILKIIPLNDYEIHNTYGILVPVQYKSIQEPPIEPHKKYGLVLCGSSNYMSHHGELLQDLENWSS